MSESVQSWLRHIRYTTEQYDPLQKIEIPKYEHASNRRTISFNNFLPVKEPEPVTENKSKSIEDLRSPPPKTSEETLQEGFVDKYKILSDNQSRNKHNWVCKAHLKLTKHNLIINSSISLNLSNARVDINTEFSTKKNVIVVYIYDKTILLIQNHSANSTKLWYNAIASVVKQLDRMPNISNLNHFFSRNRPKIEYLIERGIYKPEPIFGNFLENLSETNVPEILEQCFEVLETEKFVNSVGLYRISGNLSDIQKLRLKIDQKEYVNLLEVDVDVLAGTVKLFFRELKSPVLPYNLFKQVYDCTQQDYTSVDISKILKVLKKPYSVTLKRLLQHLNFVSQHSKVNQMTIESLAIVWGPCFTWSDEQILPDTLKFMYDQISEVLQLLIRQVHYITFL